MYADGTCRHASVATGRSATMSRAPARPTSGWNRHLRRAAQPVPPASGRSPCPRWRARPRPGPDPRAIAGPPQRRTCGSLPPGPAPARLPPATPPTPGGKVVLSRPTAPARAVSPTPSDIPRFRMGASPPRGSATCPPPSISPLRIPSCPLTSRTPSGGVPHAKPQAPGRSSVSNGLPPPVNTRTGRQHPGNARRRAQRATGG